MAVGNSVDKPKVMASIPDQAIFSFFFSIISPFSSTWAGAYERELGAREREVAGEAYWAGSTRDGPDR